MGLNFIIDMTWGPLILLSLSKKRPKKQSPDTRGAGKWRLSQCTVAPAAFWKCVFCDTLYICTFAYTQISTYTNAFVYCAFILIILLFSVDFDLGRMGVLLIVEILDFGMIKSKRLITIKGLTGRQKLRLLGGLEIWNFLGETFPLSTEMKRKSTL